MVVRLEFPQPSNPFGRLPVGDSRIRQARCANAMARPPAHSSAQVGFRCCRGQVNPAKVRFAIEKGPALRARYGFSENVVADLVTALPPAVRTELARLGGLSIANVWDWRPVGNEPLVVGAGCAGARGKRRCGVVVARMLAGSVEPLTWMWVGKFSPIVKVRGTRRRLWVYGGDRKGHYRQELWFEWGRLREGELIRNSLN